MISFDHLLLTKRDPREQARFVAFLKAAAERGPGPTHHFQVLHEHDDRCCRQGVGPPGAVSAAGRQPLLSGGQPGAQPLAGGARASPHWLPFRNDLRFRRCLGAPMRSTRRSTTISMR